MEKRLDVQKYPISAESDGFFAALASAASVSLGYAEDTPYWCAPKGAYCVRCGGCGESSGLEKHQLELYHALLTASGAAFAFDYPEDDDVGYHSMPDTPLGWRWDDSYIANAMDFAGLSYARYANKTVAEIRELVAGAIDAGYPALAANHGAWTRENNWYACWNVVCGYRDDGIVVMRHGGETAAQTEGAYQDLIVVTGRAQTRQTYEDVLRRILGVLSDPSHDRLEAEIEADLSRVTPENAAETAFKMMGINGVPIEARWHAASAFASGDNLLARLSDDGTLKREMGDLLFQRYLADGSGETHGVCWQIWGALKVGPHTGCLPNEESFALIQRPEVQAELKRLYKIVFDNDRAVAKGIREALA